MCYLRGAGMAQWREHSPPTNVAGFDSQTRLRFEFEFVVGSRPSSERFFLRVLRFSPLLKNQHFQIPFRSGQSGHRATLWMCHC